MNNDVLKSEEELPYLTSKDEPSMSAHEAWLLVRPCVLCRLELMGMPGSTNQDNENLEKWRLAVRTLDTLYPVI